MKKTDLRPEDIRAMLEEASKTSEKRILQYIHFTTVRYLSTIHFQFKTYQDETCSDKFNMYLGIHRDKLASLAGSKKIGGKLYRVPYLPIIEKLVKEGVIVDPDQFGYTPGANAKKYLLPYPTVKRICCLYWKRIYQSELDIDSTFYLESADFIKKENANRTHYPLKSLNLNKKPLPKRVAKPAPRKPVELTDKQVKCRDKMKKGMDNQLARGNLSQTFAGDMARLGGFTLTQKGYADSCCDRDVLRKLCRFIIHYHQYIPNYKAMLKHQKFDFCRDEVMAEEGRAS